jgi:putative endonuclease
MDLSKIYSVYILASSPRGVLYVGMTSDLLGRTTEHRERLVPGFTTRYFVSRLVHYEQHADAAIADARERRLKRWRRDWKIELVEQNNPTWRDLYDEVLRASGFET